MMNKKTIEKHAELDELSAGDTTDFHRLKTIFFFIRRELDLWVLDLLLLKSSGFWISGSFEPMVDAELYSMQELCDFILVGCKTLQLRLASFKFLCYC